MSRKKEPRSSNSKAVKAKDTKTMTARYRDIEGVEGIALGFRQVFFDCKEGSVTSGAGLGNGWIAMRWFDRHTGQTREAAVHALELLADWVRTWDPEEARKIDKANVVEGIGVSAEVSG